MAEYGFWNDSEFRQKVAQALQNNELIAGTSDTVPGLLAATTKQGKEQLDLIKVREKKPYLILIGSIDQAKKLSDSFKDDAVQKIVDRYWPGPLTIIVTAAKEVPAFMRAADGTIAIRMPKHDGLEELFKIYDAPLFSTSANLSGESIPERVSDIDPRIADAVSFLIDDEQYHESKPSTIVKYENGQLSVIRQGAVKI